jgi:Rrf2 family transcriptional regulator, iron-sulfur cluster assembly transcription factor
MLFLPPTRYAILALSYMAGQAHDKPLSVAKIAEEADVPEKFLAKILITLKQHKLLKAVKGPGGGYYLSRPPEEICLRDLVAAVEGPSWADKCVLGLDRCVDETPCPLHSEWSRFRRDIQEKVHQVTIHQLALKLKEKRAYLKN